MEKLGKLSIYTLTSVMTNALLLLSPLDPGLLDPQTGMHAARALKDMGIERADITTLPRYSYATPPQVHKAYAVPDFTTSARTLTEYIFRPVLGLSDIKDISDAPRSLISPELGTLSTVGTLFAHQARLPGSTPMDQHDGGDLGLIFYLAIHARPYQGKSYDLLAFPHMSRRARQSLERLGNCDGPQLDDYGATIDLGTLRNRMTRLITPAQKNALN